MKYYYTDIFVSDTLQAILKLDQTICKIQEELFEFLAKPFAYYLPGDPKVRLHFLDQQKCAFVFYQLQQVYNHFKALFSAVYLIFYILKNNIE